MSFEDCFDDMQCEVHRIAVSKGWHDEKKPITDQLLLIHAEVSEATEAMREGNPPDKHIPEFSNLEAELADVVIRIMDLVEDNHLDVSGAITAKVKYNRGRERMHGGKLF